MTIVSLYNINPVYYKHAHCDVLLYQYGYFHPKQMKVIFIHSVRAQKLTLYVEEGVSATAL